MKPRKVPISLQNKVNQEINRLVSEGVLRPIETSHWGTPIVPILNKNAETRICADYRTTLNQHMIDNKYELPDIDDIFSALCCGKYFTKLDLHGVISVNDLNSSAGLHWLCDFFRLHSGDRRNIRRTPGKLNGCFSKAYGSRTQTKLRQVRILPKKSASLGACD